MDENFKISTIEKVTSNSGLKIIRNEAIKISKSKTLEECFSIAGEFYKEEHIEVQELGVFLFGYISSKSELALKFLKEIVSKNESWKVQEVLGMAFDNFCKDNGYEESLSVIEEWVSFGNANTRRAATEGLRIWTNKPFFKEYPEMAISILSQLKNDESEYVRKSVGNALKDISKKHSELIVEELKKWDLSNKNTNQVYKLATKFAR